MADECLICKAPLCYMQRGEMMECALCHKKEESRARCIHGHYVCNDCHTQGIGSILELCLATKEKNPYAIFSQLVDLPFCHMHGPEHHIIVGAALLSAYKNAGGHVELEEALMEMQARGKEVPGGICGFWGSCGAAISAGIFISIVTGATPLSKEEWGLSNLMTSRVLARIAACGGPRCCKRNASLALETAVDFVRENLGVSMESAHITCTHMRDNAQCLGLRCPFHPGAQKENAQEAVVSGEAEKKL